MNFKYLDSKCEQSLPNCLQISTTRSQYNPSSSLLVWMIESSGVALKNSHCMIASVGDILRDNRRGASVCAHVWEYVCMCVVFLGSNVIDYTLIAKTHTA